MLQRHKTILLLTLICMFITCKIYALPSDNKKPATLSANQATYNQKTGKGIYIGNVIINQGTTRITADKLITYTNKHNQLIHAIAYGAPAHYQTQTKLNAPLLHASASQIDYITDKHLVILIGHCKVTQGSNILTGPKIEFYMKSGVMKTIPINKQRTNILFNPQKVSNLSVQEDHNEHTTR